MTALRCGALRTATLALVLLLTFMLPGTQVAQAQPRAAQQAGEEAIPPAEKDVWLRRLVGYYVVEGMVEVVYPGYGCVPDPELPGAEKPPPYATPYCKPVKGHGDCIGIGSGPGVQCVLDMPWQDLFEIVYPPEELKPDERPPPTGVYNLPGGVSNLSPAMALFGLDPGNAAIHYMLVDNKGLPESAMGTITGNRANFRTPCVNSAALLGAMKPPPIPSQPPLYRSPPRTCEKTIRIEAKPDAQQVYMTVDFDINDEPWTRYTLTMKRQPKPAAANKAQVKPAASR